MPVGWSGSSRLQPRSRRNVSLPITQSAKIRSALADKRARSIALTSDASEKSTVFFFVRILPSPTAGHVDANVSLSYKDGLRIVTSGALKDFEIQRFEAVG